VTQAASPQRAAPAWRGAGFRIFSSAGDAPRARRPTDGVLLALTIVGVALLSIPAPGPTALDRSFSAFISELPGLMGWFWEISFNLLLGWALLLLVLALVSHGRKRLFFEEVFAMGLAFGCALLAGKAGGTDWSSSVRVIGSTSPPAVYLAVRLAMATAVVVMASPHMSRPVRTIGRLVLAIGGFAGIALGVTLPIGMVAGFLVGVGSAAVVHLILGSPAGRLTLDQIAAALRDLGIGATDLRNAPLEPRGVQLALAAMPDGRSLMVKVYGRDAHEGQLLTSLWNSVWHRGETPRLASSRLEQVEHEAFVTLLADREGVPVMPVVVAGLAVEHDALLVTEATGRAFVTLTPEEIDDALLQGLWRAVVRLGELGIAHGQIDGYRLVVRPDGTPAIGDFSLARVAATDVAVMADRAQLLVTTALSIGHDRAVLAATEALGHDGLVRMLPLLQPAVLDRAARRAVKAGEWSLPDLLKRSAEGAGVEPPELERIRRVTVKSVLTVVLVGAFAYWLIASLSGIDLQQVIDELKSAEMVWLAAALLVAPVVQVFQAFSTMGASVHPMRFGPVLMLQYAIQFIQLAVPSSAARVALEVRFFERAGVDAGGSLSIGLIDAVSGFAIQLLIIVVVTVFGLASISLSSSSTSSSSTSSGSSSSGVDTWVLVVALLVLGAIVAFAVPKSRAAIKDAVPRYRATLRRQASSAVTALRVLRDPKNVGLLFGGNLMAQVLLAIVLGLCLRAFGYTTSFAGLILVNTFVSLFAGFMPVPGGMGVAEAGYTAGLQALGIPSAAAMSTAIAFRLVTFYLPPIWGTFAMRWLRRNSYV